MNYYLFKIIACPVCNGNLYYNEKLQELICQIDKLVYPLQNGIYFLLESEASHY